MQYSIVVALVITTLLSMTTPAAEIRVTIVDAETAKPVAARIYLRNSSGQYVHVTDSVGGTIIPYSVIRGASSEIHTSVSAHPCKTNLPAGEYELTVERGKEYFPARATITLDDSKLVERTIPIRRWTEADMASRGWYSGETHVHRSLAELPTLMQAEDLNVAFPLTAWVTDSREAPSRNNKNKEEVPPAQLVQVDATHVIWPINTEYEIFTVEGKSHTLGAVFVLNHRESLQLKAPPVGPIAAEARRQRGFLELDKHNWPWSMMLVPQMKVELFELTNNHIWRTEFLFKDWYPEYVPDYMKIEMQDGRFTERGWVDFGFQTYYALLNCGFDMKPTGGTASGVHPVPLGFGRVYVKLDGDFSYEAWIAGLLAGRSFVTTGPMLTVDMRRLPQHILVSATTESMDPIRTVEIVVNGEVTRTIDAQPQRTSTGAYRFKIDEQLDIEDSCWVAVRAFAERPNRRPSFAHSAPVRFELDQEPSRPTQAQKDYLIERVAEEIKRHRDVLPVEAVREYEEALRHFEAVQARP